MVNTLSRDSAQTSQQCNRLCVHKGTNTVLKLRVRVETGVSAEASVYKALLSLTLGLMLPFSDNSSLTSHSQLRQSDMRSWKHWDLSRANIAFVLNHILILATKKSLMCSLTGFSAAVASAEPHPTV